MTTHTELGKVQSVRLTEEMRGVIAAALVRHKIAKRQAAFEKAEFKLAQRVYQSEFSAADRRKMEALPDGWLPTTEHLRVKVGSDWRWLHFGPQVRDGKRETRRIPANREKVIELNLTSEIAQAVRDYAAEGAAIQREEAALREKAHSVLASVTTTARLAEIWPEAIPFIPKSVPRLLPVVRREELNAAFGLPVSA